MKRLTLTLLVVTMLLVAACGTSLVAVPPPELDGVTEALGYSLAPTRLPEGFKFYWYDVLGDEIATIKPDGQVVMPLEGPSASVLYNRFKDYASQSILIMYPQSFSPSVSDNFIFESLGLDWQRPDDAISEVKVNGETAHLVRGSWSAETLTKLARLDPDLAEYTPGWDYDMYLTLYFDFELSPDEVVGVMVQALLYPADWITAKELVKIAESIKRID